ncbi:MAG: alpha/beta fold hydrolase [Lacunisphaera sp.]
MQLLKRLLLVVFAAVVGCAAISAFFAWRLTSPPRRIVGEPSPEIAVFTQPVAFPSRDGFKLSGWLVSAPNSTKAVVLLHGNGSSRRQMLARAHLFHEVGYTVLLYDARGHGMSEGDKVSAGWFETSDLLGALDFLRAKGFKEFGCLGASQGGATILLAAEKLPSEVRWVIIESTYPTMRDALDRRFREDLHLPGWLAGIFFVPLAEWRLGLSIDQISPITHVSSLHCPVFVLGGETDQHTLSISTQALFAAAREPKELWLVPGAAHVDLYGFAQQEYAKRILAFVAKSERKR